jgi:hypothetical protein
VDEERRSAPLWICASTAVSAVYAFFVLVLPAWGLTFLGDDFQILARCEEGRPRGWFVPFNQHWMPLGIGFLDLQHLVFGNHYQLHVATTWAIHSANVFLLGLLLGARARDDRAGALAALAFGVVTAWRDHFWWAGGQFAFHCFFWLVLALLALERDLEFGGWRRFAAVALALATFAWSAGLTCGPVVALEAFVLARPRRMRTAATLLAVWGGYVILYLVFAAGNVPSTLPRTREQLGESAIFLAQAIGLGFLRQVPALDDVAPTPLAAASLALLYAALVAFLAWAVDARARARLVLAHVLLAAYLVPVALTRWSHVRSQHPSAMGSQYQYIGALAWTTALALALAPLLRRRPYPTALLVLVLVGFLGERNARAARHDATTFSPTTRRFFHEPEIVAALVSAASVARAPIYDAPLPFYLGFGFTSAREAVLVAAPRTRVTWTKLKEDASVAPYRSDPTLREAFPELVSERRD